MTGGKKYHAVLAKGRNLFLIRKVKSNLWADSQLTFGHSNKLSFIEYPDFPSKTVIMVKKIDESPNRRYTSKVITSFGNNTEN